MVVHRSHTIRSPRALAGSAESLLAIRPKDLGRVSKVPSGPRRLARRLAALSGSSAYAQYADDPPPCDAPHQTPRTPPFGRTTLLSKHALGPLRAGRLLFLLLVLLRFLLLFLPRIGGRGSGILRRRVLGRGRLRPGF